MAATWTMATLSDRELLDCLKDASSLLDFELISDDRYFDAEDETYPLISVLRKIGGDELTLAWRGEVIFPRYYTVDEQPKYCSPERVAQISDSLLELDLTSF